MNHAQVKELLKAEGLHEGMACFDPAFAAALRVRDWAVNECVDATKHTWRSVKAVAEDK